MYEILNENINYVSTHEQNKKKTINLTSYLNEVNSCLYVFRLMIYN